MAAAVADRTRALCAKDPVAEDPVAEVPIGKVLEAGRLARFGRTGINCLENSLIQ
jgi:hypothetical protein